MRVRDLLIGTLCGLGIGATAAVWAVNARDLAREEQNLAIAMEFYDLLLNQKDFEAGTALMGDEYIQHNPNAPDGYAGIRAHIEMLQQRYPQNHGEIKHVFTYGDMVALHVHSKRTPDSRGNAVVDMFRLKDGKVVEHWDVVQAVPETALNDNTMF